MFEEKIKMEKNLNYYFLILTFQEKYDYEAFIKTKKNIQKFISFDVFIKFLKDSKLISISLYKKIIEKSFLNDYIELESFIESCSKDLYSFYIKYFYAGMLSTFPDSDEFIENLDDEYLNDIFLEYSDCFDKKALYSGYTYTTEFIYFVNENILSPYPIPRFPYISCPKLEINNLMNNSNKEKIEDLLDGLDALTTDEISKNIILSLRKEIIKN